MVLANWCNKKEVFNVSLKRKTKTKLYIIPMILLFIAILVIYYNNYKDTVQIIKSEYEAKVDLVEKSIYNETKYTGIISNLAENDISEKMKNNSQVLIEKYANEPNILDWDLNTLKTEFEGMDIYILDEDLIIIASTVREEIGMDFGQFKDFGKLLRKRLEGGSFESDTINFSILESQMKKFSYMPTPDNKYLLELSVDIGKAYPEIKNLNIVYLTEELVDKYPFVEDIRVYKYNTNKKGSYELDTIRKKARMFESLKDDRDIYVKKALDQDQAQEQIIKDENNKTYRLKYIPYTTYYEDNSITWWDSYVIEIIYNDESLIKSIDHQDKVFFNSMLVLLILYSGFSYMVINVIKKSRERANLDYLTKLPNRKKFEDVIEYEMARANKDNTKIAVLFFDLNDFKKINDTHGHNIGDRVLQEAAFRIQNEMRKEDLAFRIGGDEFVGLIPNLKASDEINEIAERISLIFDKEIYIDKIKISIKSSLGVSIYPDHGKTIDELLSKADEAMYRAKVNNKNFEISE